MADDPVKLVERLRGSATWGALAPGDRFDLTGEGRQKLRPKGTPGGRILGDSGDCWKVRFDGTTPSRVIHKAYIRAPKETDR